MKWPCIIVYMANAEGREEKNDLANSHYHYHVRCMQRKQMCVVSHSIVSVSFIFVIFQKLRIVEYKSTKFM